MDCGAAVFCPVCSLCHCANFGKPKGLGCGGTKVFFRSPSVERMFDQSSGTRQLWKVSNTDTKLVMQCVCMFIFERCLWSSAKKVLTDVLLFDTFRRNKTEHAGIYIHIYIILGPPTQNMVKLRIKTEVMFGFQVYTSRAGARTGRRAEAFTPRIVSGRSLWNLLFAKVAKEGGTIAGCKLTKSLIT